MSACTCGPNEGCTDCPPRPFAEAPNIEGAKVILLRHIEQASELGDYSGVRNLAGA